MPRKKLIRLFPNGTAVLVNGNPGIVDFVDKQCFIRIRMQDGSVVKADKGSVKLCS